MVDSVVLRCLRKNGPFVGTALACLVGLSLFVVWPLLAELGQADTSAHASAGSKLDIFRERGITAAAGLWFFVLGANIGSFLNVVAYRMPMGMTFVSKPSRCPYCETPIRFRHNVPIFGWLALRGRCYACKLPISIRYPLVELIVGGLFFLLFCRELASGGANLPAPYVPARPGILWNVLTPNWPLIGLYFFHCLLLSILATIALIKFDRLRIPMQLVAFSLIVPTICRVAWPSLGVLPWSSPSALTPISGSFADRLGASILGVTVGALVGWALHPLVEPARRRTEASGTGIMAILAIAGVFLGWQMMVPLAMIVVLFQFVTMSVGRIFDRATAKFWSASCLWAGTFVICFWRHLPRLGLPSPIDATGTHWLWLWVVLAAAYVTARLSSASAEG